MGNFIILSVHVLSDGNHENEVNEDSEDDRDIPLQLKIQKLQSKCMDEITYERKLAKQSSQGNEENNEQPQHGLQSDIQKILNIEDSYQTGLFSSLWSYIRCRLIFHMRQ